MNVVQEWQLPEGPSREQRRRAKLEKAMQAKIAADAARDRAAAEKSMHAAIHGGADPDLVTEGEYGDDTPIDWYACSVCLRVVAAQRFSRTSCYGARLPAGFIHVALPGVDTCTVWRTSI